MARRVSTLCRLATRPRISTRRLPHFQYSTEAPSPTASTGNVFVDLFGSGPKLTNTQVSRFNQYLARLRVAFVERNVNDAWHVLETLRKHNMLRLVSRHDALDISNFVLPSLREPASLNENDRGRCEDLAIYAATLGEDVAASHNMAALVRAGAYEHAVAFFERYAESVLKKSSEAENELEEELSIEGSAEEQPHSLMVHPDSSKSIPQNSSRQEILFSYLAALSSLPAASRPSTKTLLSALLPLPILYYSRDLDPFLRTHLELPSQTSEQNLVYLRARAYLRDYTLARYVRSIRAVRLWAEMFRERDSEAVLAQWEDVEVALKEGWLAPVNDAGWSQEDRPVALNDTHWSMLMSGFTGCQRHDLTRRVWGVLNESINSLQPTPEGETSQIPQVAWTCMLDGLGKSGDVDSAVEVWNMMQERGVEKNVIAYSCLISALFQARQPDNAMLLFLEAKAKAAAGQLEVSLTPPSDSDPLSTPASYSTLPKPKVQKELSLLLPVRTYNAVLHGLLISSRSTSAQILFTEMRKQGPTPDIVTYNILLRYYSRQPSKMADFTRILREIPTVGLSPDPATFTTVIDAMRRKGVDMKDAMRHLLGVMQELKVQPNEVTFGAILDSIVRGGEEDGGGSYKEGWDRIGYAVDMIDKMEQSGMRVTEVSYTSLIAAVYRLPSAPPSSSSHLSRSSSSSQDLKAFLAKHDGDAAASHLLHRMKQRNLKPNRVTYNILIKAALSIPASPSTTPLAVARAMHYYDEMTHSSSGMRPNRDTWHLLLAGLHAQGETTLARQVVEDMGRWGFYPTGVSLVKLVERIQRGEGPRRGDD